MTIGGMSAAFRCRCPQKEDPTETRKCSGSEIVCTYIHYIALHYMTLHYIALHYTTLHSVTLRYIALHYTTLHYITSQT